MITAREFREQRDTHQRLVKLIDAEISAAIISGRSAVVHVQLANGFKRDMIASVLDMYHHKGGWKTELKEQPDGFFVTLEPLPQTGMTR